uniref:Uncharacterized protein n=1 Tax=Arundo donax TaxID=35708 RepID=A0A0A9FZZ6_ARUDO
MCLPHIAAAAHPHPCAVPSCAFCQQQLHPSPIPSIPPHPPLPPLPSAAAPPLPSVAAALRALPTAGWSLQWRSDGGRRPEQVMAESSERWHNQVGYSRI